MSWEIVFFIKRLVKNVKKQKNKTLTFIHLSENNQAF